MIVTRQLYLVETSQPIALTTIEQTGTVVWSEVVAPGTEEPTPTAPVYGRTYADELVTPQITTFDMVYRLFLAYLAAPQVQKQLIIDVMAAVALSAPVYAVEYDSDTGLYTVTVPPPVDYIENHNWAGWPMHPVPPNE